MGCTLVIMLVTGQLRVEIRINEIVFTDLSLVREHNMIRFHHGKPTGIYYSQHSSGSAYSWDDKGLSVENGRVLNAPDSLTDFDHAANVVLAHRLQRMGFSRKLGISRVSALYCPVDNV